ncbi:MAG: ABC transporter permease [Chloroflexi bacterium]|nr:ABC transporter permease [Chloroflexota bacterium]MCL5108058.1 ABC transporter permease [Chloroflexota bacterium]
MTAFVARRLLQTIPVLLLSSVAIFLLLRLAPGDPAQYIAGPDASAEGLAAARREMGLDQPWPIQYAVWLTHAVRGDFGIAFVTRYPVWDLVLQVLPATIELALAALILSTALGFVLGVVGALREGQFVDLAVGVLNAIALGVPNFWLGLILIIVFALVLRWLPPSGHVDFVRDPGQSLRYLTLPAITLAVQLSAVLARFVRASLLDVLHEDYVRTARAKGLPERSVIVRHALRNALIPVVTVMGLQFGRLLGGAVIVEAVFGWPGIGSLVITGVVARDYTVVQGVLTLLVTTFVLINLLTDLLYGVLDPAVRLGQKGGA